MKLQKMICTLIAVMLMITCAIPALANDDMFTGAYVELIGDMNVRNEPFLTGELLAIAETGEQLAFLEQASVDERGVVWYLIERDGVEGWVSSKYSMLTDGNLTGLSFETGELGGEKKVAKAADLFTAPAADSGVLAQLEAETIVEYMNYSLVDGEQTWIFVNAGENAGWILSDCIAEIEE